MKNNYKEALTSEEWGKIYSDFQVDKILKSIKNEEYSAQTKEMIKITKEGEKVLEIGSGTGATSISLALNNRLITSLDFSKECLGLTQIIAKELNCKVETVMADARIKLPFKENTFDTCFQAGLLEHFDRDERIKLIKNWSTVAKRQISMIPNAACLSYRVGKSILEKNNKWPYGKELPQYSLQDEFREAGLKVIKEYTIGESNALYWLPNDHYLKQAIKRWINENPCEDNCGQGYLLVTIGEKI